MMKSDQSSPFGDFAVISDQSKALLEESEAVLRAAEEYVEAVRRSKRLKRKEPIERRLELAMRKAFREQGRQFERTLRKFRDRFDPTPVPSSNSESMNLERGDDDEELKESILPTEWMFVFHAVAQRTLVLFSKPIDRAVRAALLAGGTNQIAELGVGISFTLDNPRAVTYLTQYGAKLVTKINETTRDYIGTIIEQATKEGWSYDRIAEALTERYEEFAIGKPQAHIDSRAHLIAVTETGNAYTEGQLQAAQELEAAGLEMEKAWDTVGDDKVSEGCRGNAAVGWIKLDASFPSGHQRPLRFPGCRCDLLTRVKK
ncbi:MAG: phage minor head protein [Chloroflexota bacterium]